MIIDFYILKSSPFQMPLFGRAHKSPQDIIKNLRDALILIEKGDKKADKAVEEVNRYLQAVKLIIYGGESQEPQTEQVHILFPLLITNLFVFRLLSWRKRLTTQMFCHCSSRISESWNLSQKRMWR
jgi:hypothetical protein